MTQPEQHAEAALICAAALKAQRPECVAWIKGRYMGEMADPWTPRGLHVVSLIMRQIMTAGVSAEIPLDVRRHMIINAFYPRPTSGRDKVVWVKSANELSRMGHRNKAATLVNMIDIRRRVEAIGQAAMNRADESLREAGFIEG